MGAAAKALRFARPVGLMIGRRFDSVFRDVVFVRPMQRRDGEVAPMGVCSDWDFPGLDDLELRVYRLDCGDLSVSVEFREVYSADLTKLRAMERVLSRVSKQITKDEAMEAGDVLMSLARSLDAEWVCEKLEREAHGSCWSDWTWAWHSVPAGRDRFRAMVSEIPASTKIAA